MVMLGTTVQWMGGGAVLLLGTILMATGPTPHVATGTTPDSTGAKIDVTRTGTLLRVRALYSREAPPADTLSYELTVDRSGTTGTTQTTQSGTFTPLSGRTDTLSTVQVNVQSGDRLRLHLAVQNEEGLVDVNRVERTIE